ncbi:DUF4160 domain-containing protein [Amphiplicatus metriothermophilus]|uniref:DUF4160 domain-containing protein n=1 Tax=Amphiplicatus metriothermophilus TaxID=1519374 RepID=A0A239PUR7_9PROT|nr:DUF4160 domain-containing protein [Amphiplicatus metriothermophilus]MBB5519338.1 hypothetical protein [Amphiplicatus metriothermophilus]SNT73427.1 protein of unknown function [Amphiplicatus metriothermophilus]
MPPVLKQGPCRLFFYSNEGSPREPVHAHVRSGGNEAKIWLHPAVCAAESFGFNSKELKDMISLVEANRTRIEQAWHDHFGR